MDKETKEGVLWLAKKPFFWFSLLFTFFVFACAYAPPMPAFSTNENWMVLSCACGIACLLFVSIDLTERHIMEKLDEIEKRAV